MKLRILAISIVLMFAMIAASMTEASATGTFEKFGSRVDDIIFRVAGSLGAESTELQNGLIDYMDWAVEASKLSAWEIDPNIVLETYSEAGWYEYDLNLQMWPIGHGSMRPELGAEGGAAPTSGMSWTFPPTWDEGHYWIDYSCQRCLDSREFRRALAHLTDRDSIDITYPRTLAMMETFIFPTIGGWENPDAPKYEYSILQAKQHLDDGGFKDYDGDGRREYNKNVAARNAWLPGQQAPAGTEEIPDIQVLRRTDDPPRNTAGQLLESALQTVFVAYDDIAGGYSQITPGVWDNYNYHIYTGGWGWTPTPDMYYECWNSKKDNYPSTDGDNYNRYHSAEYDAISWAMKSAPNATYGKTKCFEAQAMLHDDVACIPLYTMGGYVARRAKYGSHTGEEQYAGLPWLGFIDEQGYGYYGGSVGFSSLNAHPQGYERGGTIRAGLIDPPDKIDPVDSESFYEAQILSKIYEPLIIRNPTDIASFIPWLITGPAVEGTWDNNGRTCSKVTVTLRSNVLFHDNVPVTPQDVEFSYWYMHEANAVAHSTSVKEYHHCNIVGNTIEIFWNTTSFLALDWVSDIQIIPKHIWQDYPPTQPGDPTQPGSWSFDPVAAEKLIGTGPFRADKDGVIGKLDIQASNMYIHLSANPTYHRKLVQPDFAKPPAGPGQPVQPVSDGKIDASDFGMTIGKFGDVYSTSWPDPTWDPRTDVNKDLAVDLDDIMETGARYGLTGCQGGYPPEYA